jgi:phospholipase/carboxylesterase
MQIDAEAVRWSKSDDERSGKPLVVLIHGYSGTENTLFDVVSADDGVQAGNVVLASLRGPVDASIGGNAWFEPGDRAIGEPAAEQVDLPAQAILEWLDTLDYSSVSLFSFSQGGLTALQLLRHAPRRFAATVVLGGCVAPDVRESDAEVTRVRPKVFYGMGEVDEAIPAKAIERSHLWLAEHTAPTFSNYPGLGHAISPEELADAMRFIVDALD